MCKLRRHKVKDRHTPLSSSCFRVVASEENVVVENGEEERWGKPVDEEDIKEEDDSMEVFSSGRELDDRLVVISISSIEAPALLKCSKSSVWVCSSNTSVVDVTELEEKELNATLSLV